MFAVATPEKELAQLKRRRDTDNETTMVKCFNKNLRVFG